MIRPQLEIANGLSSVFSGIGKELARSFRVPNLIPSNLIQSALPSLSLGVNEALESLLAPILKSIPPIVHPKARVAVKTGWVVHRTLPRSLLEEASEDNLDEAIMTHYQERWDEVRSEIEGATSRYLVDRDSKETMKQALKAHELYLYRLVPRAMMAEIERAARVQLREELVGSPNIKETILSRVDDLPISSFYDLTSGMIQYEALERHLYERIGNENHRSQFADNPIPNRHAAVHGLVPFSSEKTSLNSIFLADFVFHLITEFKREKIAEVAGVLEGRVLAAKSKQSG